jgi:hypothetical protein
MSLRGSFQGRSRSHRLQSAMMRLSSVSSYGRMCIVDRTTHDGGVTLSRYREWEVRLAKELAGIWHERAISGSRGAGMTHA